MMFGWWLLFRGVYFPFLKGVLTQFWASLDFEEKKRQPTLVHLKICHTVFLDSLVTDIHEWRPSQGNAWAFESGMFCWFKQTRLLLWNSVIISSSSSWSDHCMMCLHFILLSERTRIYSMLQTLIAFAIKWAGKESIDMLRWLLLQKKEADSQIVFAYNFLSVCLSNGSHVRGGLFLTKKRHAREKKVKKQVSHSSGDTFDHCHQKDMHH